MDSADSPLGVHSFHRGGHYQRHYSGTGKVQQSTGPIGSGHTFPASVYRPVPVRAALCQEVAGIGRPRMKAMPKVIWLGCEARNARPERHPGRQCRNDGDYLRYNRAH